MRGRYREQPRSPEAGRGIVRLDGLPQLHACSIVDLPMFGCRSAALLKQSMQRGSSDRTGSRRLRLGALRLQANAAIRLLVSEDSKVRHGAHAGWTSQTPLPSSGHLPMMPLMERNRRPAARCTIFGC